eukprot:gb/GFBE01006267.1/.p2 GENE.gb/GFBE01006267.1/~~gb/GFBE01006267.1/.p2  ORF type:complete len:150 (-),score=12.32 gb/GFBE01006267.1/:30-479(-)
MGDSSEELQQLHSSTSSGTHSEPTLLCRRLGRSTLAAPIKVLRALCRTMEAAAPSAAAQGSSNQELSLVEQEEVTLRAMWLTTLSVPSVESNVWHFAKTLFHRSSDGALPVGTPMLLPYPSLISFLCGVSIEVSTCTGLKAGLLIALRK